MIIKNYKLWFEFHDNSTKKEVKRMRERNFYLFEENRPIASEIECEFQKRVYNPIKKLSSVDEIFAIPSYSLPIILLGCLEPKKTKEIIEKMRDERPDFTVVLYACDACWEKIQSIKGLSGFYFITKGDKENEKRVISRILQHENGLSVV